MKSERNKSLLVFLALILLGTILVGKDLFRPSELYFKAVRDPNPWVLSYPWRAFIIQSFKAFEFPLWNPYSGLGMPFLANYQSGVFSFLRYPFYFLPFSLIIAPFILFQLVFAGFGAWLFAKSQKLSDLSSLVCAVGFMFSGYLVQYLNNQHLVIDLLIPYGFLFADRIQEKANLKNFLILILILVLALLGGQPGSSLFTLSFIFIYFLYQALVRKLRKGIIILFSAFSLSLLLASIQILPFLEALPHYWTFHLPGYAKNYLDLKTFASIIAPGIFGPADKLAFPIQKSMPWLGTIIVFLGLLSLFNLGRLKAQNNFFWLISLLGLGIIYGLPGFNLPLYLPGLDRLSWVKYLEPIITFSLVMLAGIAMEAIIKKIYKLKFFLPLMVSFIILTSGLVFSFQYNPSLKNWAIGSFLFSSALLLLALWTLKSKYHLKWLFLFLVVLEPIIWHRLVDKPAFWIDLEKAELSRFRKLAQQFPLARFSAEPTVWIPNQMVSVPLSDLGVDDPLIPKRYVQLVSYLNHYKNEQEMLQDFYAYHSIRLKESAFSEPVSKILSAKFFIRKTSPTSHSLDLTPGFWIPGEQGLKSAYTLTALYGDPIYLSRISDSLPRIFSPTDLIASNNEKDSFEKLLKIKNYQKQAVVETKIGMEIPSSLIPLQILDFKIQPGKILLHYQSEGNAFAIFNEQYFPGWRAYLDKEEVKIYSADFLLRGVFLKSGEHNLIMVYEPYGFRIGFYLFLSTLLFIITIFLLRSLFSSLIPAPPLRAS